MNLLGVIPARGGSKGIPHKNIVDLCGRSLIAYTIETCLRSGVFSRLVVSTDDPDIAEAARAAGAEVPFMRPGSLAGDAISPQEAVQFTVERLREGGCEPEGLAVLFPTHPFRSVSMLRLLVGKMDDHHVVKTVVGIRPDPMTFLCENETGALEPLLNATGGACYAPVGNFFGVGFGKTRHEYFLHPLTDPVERIDIDTPADLDVAREIIARGLYDFDA